MKPAEIFPVSPQKADPALPEVTLFFYESTYGRAGAWGYELTYQDHKTYRELKKEEMGLLTDCEQTFRKPAITAAYEALISLKRKCRIGLDARSSSLVEDALRLVFDEKLEDEYGLLGDFEGVPGWSQLVEAMRAHSIYFVEMPMWSPKHPLIKKVEQKLREYIETQPDLKQRQLEDDRQRWLAGCDVDSWSGAWLQHFALTRALLPDAAGLIRFRKLRARQQHSEEAILPFAP